MYILALLLAGGFICNLLIRPVPERWFTVGEAHRPAPPTASLATAQTKAGFLGS